MRNPKPASAVSAVSATSDEFVSARAPTVCERKLIDRTFERVVVSACYSQGANFPWRPKLVTDVDAECEGINDTATVVVLMEEAGDRWDELTAAMTAVAEEVRSGEEARGQDARGVLFMAGAVLHALGAKNRSTLVRVIFRERVRFASSTR